MQCLKIKIIKYKIVRFIYHNELFVTNIYIGVGIDTNFRIWFGFDSQACD